MAGSLCVVNMVEFRMNSYEDMNDNVNSQNGAWMTSWLSDDTEKLIGSIRNQSKDTVKI